MPRSFFSAMLPHRWSERILQAAGTATDPPAKPNNVPDTLAIQAEGDLQILEAAAGDEEGAAKVPTFTMVAYTGGKMRPLGFSVDVVADLKGMKIAPGKRPALFQHNSDKPVGHFEAGDISNDGKRIKASGVLSVDGEDRQRLIQSSRDGFPWKASIGARYSWDDMEFVAADQSREVNGKKQRGPFYLVKAATIYEISFVTVAGDDSASAAVKAQSSTEGKMKFEAWLQAKGFDINTLSAKQHASMRAAWEAELKASGAGNPADDDTEQTGQGTGTTQTTPIQAAGTVQPPPLPTGGQNDPIAELRASMAAEITRTGEIGKLFASAASGVPEEKRTELHAKAISENWSAEKCELELLRARRSDLGAGGQFSIQASQDRTSYGVLVAATAMSLGVPQEIAARGLSEQDVDLATQARYRTTSLHALMDRVHLQAHGYHFSGNRKSDEFFQAAMSAERQLRGQGWSSLRASGNTTISLTGILGAAAHKSLIASFESIEGIHPQLCRSANHTDFKTHNRYRLDINGGYKPVGPDGELQHSKMEESQFTSKLGTHGTILTLTRQDMINDDLDAFNQIVAQLGIMAAIVMEEEFWKMVLANANNFFSEANGNLVTGADYALSIDGLTLAEAAFSDRVKSDGTPILMSPSLLVTGSTLKVTARDLYNETNVDVTTTANKPKIASNPHKGMYKPLSSSYINNTKIRTRTGAALSNQSATKYLLFADPKIRAAFVCATLNGQTLPTIQSDESDFNTLGMQWRGFHDFGFGEEEPEAACMFTGAA